MIKIIRRISRNLQSNKEAKPNEVCPKKELWKIIQPIQANINFPFSRYILAG
jgi:hypothetical protein